MAPRKSKHVNKLSPPHAVDRFASFANKQVYRYNAKWRDGNAESVDSLHLSDLHWRRKNN